MKSDLKTDGGHHLPETTKKVILKPEDILLKRASVLNLLKIQIT
ncbi:hypothetical protein [Chryseobacterium sp.]|nr:hypothetical protein [Chryseobacterium sp.]